MRLCCLLYAVCLSHTAIGGDNMIFKINAISLSIGSTVSKAEMFLRLTNNDANTVVKAIYNGYDYQIISIIEDGE